jgi:hypothetical protein
MMRPRCHLLVIYPIVSIDTTGGCSFESFVTLDRARERAGGWVLFNEDGVKHAWQQQSKKHTQKERLSIGLAA